MNEEKNDATTHYTNVMDIQLALIDCPAPDSPMEDSASPASASDTVESEPNPTVMHVVVRSDLAGTLGRPVGSVFPRNFKSVFFWTRLSEGI